MDDLSAWADPIPSGADPVETLVPYWAALVAIVHPIREDAMVAQDWLAVKHVLNVEPVPPTTATWIWNMRWRQAVAYAWTMVEAHATRLAARRAS